MRTVVFDFAPEVHAAASEFWRVALAAELRPGTTYPEYHVLEHPAATGSVLTQLLGDGPSRIHLDIESDDAGAEVARLCRAGASVVEVHDDWTVLVDPAGNLFCVVPPDSEDFAALAHLVE